MGRQTAGSLIAPPSRADPGPDLQPNIGMNSPIPSPTACPEPQPGWEARLELRFGLRDGGTRLVGRRHEGPLMVQRPFYPEGEGVCHVYILHPPGGIVEGDRLHLEIVAESGAHALLTTPAASKFYRSEKRSARLVQRIRVESGAFVEWLPQETIAFAGARATADLEVHLAGSARFIGLDVWCLGRPAAGERFDRGRCVVRQTLTCDGEPRLIERALFEGGGEMLGAAWGLGGRPVYGTLLAFPAPPDGAGAVRDAVPQLTADELFGMTTINGVLVCRYAGQSTERAKRILRTAWGALRPRIGGRPACPPRIWNT